MQIVMMSLKGHIFELSRLICKLLEDDNTALLPAEPPGQANWLANSANVSVSWLLR